MPLLGRARGAVLKLLRLPFAVPGVEALREESEEDVGGEDEEDDVLGRGGSGGRGGASGAEEYRRGG